MNLGQELKKDMCPEKYYAKGVTPSDIIPVTIALLIVAFFSGSLLNGAKINMGIIIAFESAFVLGLGAFLFFMVKGQKKRMAEVYISVCQYGICGVCHFNGFKNRPFELPYNQISAIEVKGDRIIITAQKEKAILTLTDALGTEAAIREAASKIR